MEPTLLVQVLPGNEDLGLPAYATQDAAGMDLKAALKAEMVIAPGERDIVPIGIKVSIPSGYEGSVRPRSGLAMKFGLTLTNSPGTIDSDYRGEFKVLLINHGKEPVTLRRGDRIAQLVITPVARVKVVERKELEKTPRGEGGFGHTGM